MEKLITLNRAEGSRRPQIENAKINEKGCSQAMGIRIWTCPWTNRWRWIALKALEVPKLKTQKSAKNDAPKAWESEYEHVHGQTDSAESRWRAVVHVFMMISSWWSYHHDHMIMMIWSSWSYDYHDIIMMIRRTRHDPRSVQGPFWVHFRVIQGSSRVHLGVILGLFKGFPEHFEASSVRLSMISAQNQFFFEKKNFFPDIVQLHVGVLGVADHVFNTPETWKKAKNRPYGGLWKAPLGFHWFCT